MFGPVDSHLRRCVGDILFTVTRSLLGTRWAHQGAGHGFPEMSGRAVVPAAVRSATGLSHHDPREQASHVPEAATSLCYQNPRGCQPERPSSTVSG